MKLLVTLNDERDIDKITKLSEDKRLTPSTFARTLIVEGLKKYE